MKIICLDNHALIWGIKEQSTKGQEKMIPLTKRFIDSIDSDTSVLIPAIVVAEFLMPIPQELHAMVINLFNKNFIIAPFDALCASKFSIVWNTNKDKAEELLKQGATRGELKADGLIVATAIARKAECIYSYDKWISSIAPPDLSGFLSDFLSFPCCQLLRSSLATLPTERYSSSVTFLWRGFRDLLNFWFSFYSLISRQSYCRRSMNVSVTGTFGVLVFIFHSRRLEITFSVFALMCHTCRSVEILSG